MKYDISPWHVVVCSRARLFAECRLQVVKHNAALGPIGVEPSTPTVLAISSSLAPASAASKISARFELARRMLAAAEKCFEFITFGLAELTQ
jgi:hypothetical protein